MIGSLVDQRFRIVRLLGAGGMGSVYEGVDTTDGQRVAVKVITAETTQDPVQMARFEREARASSSIDTPHITKVLRTGKDAATGLPYIVMELLDGEDVQQLFRRLGPLPADLALRIAAQGLAGLERAHATRVIHRDMKPANLFLARSGEGRVIKLGDFGVAKIRRDPEGGTVTAGLTRTGSMLGSPLYMAPEQARGHKDIDYRADVWSMGVVLYQMLSGATPHPDVTALGELVVAICTEQPVPLREAAPWVAPEVAAVVHGALQVEREDRYQDAAAMRAAILRLLPDGTAIDDSMLRALTDAERAPRAETAEAPKSAPAPAVNEPPPVSAPASAPARPPSRRGPEIAPRGRAPMIAAIAAAGLLAGGYAAFRLLAPAPAVPVAPIAPTQAAPRDVRPRHVKLVIVPATAQVEIDGARVVAIDGVVEIQGALGTVHKARVFSGGDEIVKDVVVTEGGALPPNVTLVVTPPSAHPSATHGPGAKPGEAPPMRDQR